MEKNTNLAVVAPSIAEALFATAVGLAAAIPAYIAYNKFSTDTAKFTGRLEAFADDLATALNRRLMKAYLLKESLDRLWDYRYEGAMLNYLKKWIEQLKWQRLPAFDKLARTLWNHREGIMNYCRTKVRFGVVEAVNGNIRMLINRGRGYQNLRYLLLKSKRIAVTNVAFIAVSTVKNAA